jgi:multidrug efflux system membrane fusion protein
MTAAVRLARPGDPQVVVLPLTAIYQKDGVPAVWVVEPAQSKVELREVRVGQYREEGVGITAGLRAGEIVVTAGVHKLVPGQQVRLNDAPAAPK